MTQQIVWFIAGVAGARRAIGSAFAAAEPSHIPVARRGAAARARDGWTPGAQRARTGDGVDSERRGPRQAALAVSRAA